MSVVSRSEFGVVYSRAKSPKLYIRFKGPDGREVRKSAETEDQGEALDFLKEQFHRARSLSWENAVVEFFEVHAESRLRATTIAAYEDRLNAVDPYLRGLLLVEITQEVLKDLMRQEKLRGVSDTTVKRCLSFISTVFSNAIDTIPGAPEVNPVLQLNKRRLKEVKRSRWLTRTEFNQLMEACWEDMHRDVIDVAVHTGMRKSELCGLRQQMIDWKARKINLPEKLNKNKRPRTIPLGDHAFRTLEKVCENAPDDLVFWHRNGSGQPQPYPDFRKFFESARRRAGLEDLRFHDLRHTFASWWVQKGGSLSALQKIMGHSSIQSVERYAHLDVVSTQREMKKIFPHTFDTIED